MNRIQEIEDRLAKATPGPWAWATGWHCSDSGPTYVFSEGPRYQGTHSGSSIPDDHPQVDADADLIANAPADIAYLLDYVSDLESEAQSLRAQLRVAEGMEPA